MDLNVLEYGQVVELKLPYKWLEPEDTKIDFGISVDAFFDVKTDKEKEELRKINQIMYGRKRIKKMKTIILDNESRFTDFTTLTLDIKRLNKLGLNTTKPSDIYPLLKVFLEQTRRYAKSMGKEFYYIWVMEFTKKGNIHYHMLSNLGEMNLIEPLIKHRKNGVKYHSFSQRDKKRFYHYTCKYWSYGFVQNAEVTSIKGATRYVSKYMTKFDNECKIDNVRLFNRSQNLKVPEFVKRRLPNENEKELRTRIKKLKINFKNEYVVQNSYTGKNAYRMFYLEFESDDDKLDFMNYVYGITELKVRTPIEVITDSFDMAFMELGW